MGRGDPGRPRPLQGVARGAVRPHHGQPAGCRVDRSLYAEAEHRGRVARDPAARLRGLRGRDERAGRVLTLAEARAVLGAVLRDAEAPPRRLRALRDRAILAVLIRTGLRRGELAGLRVGDLGESGGHQVLTVRGKGAVVRTAKLPPDVRRDITVWLDAAGAAGLPSARPTRSSCGWPRAGRVRDLIPLSGRAVHAIVAERLRAVGIAGLGPHTLRATFVTLALEGHAPLHLVQRQRAKPTRGRPSATGAGRTGSTTTRWTTSDFEPLLCCRDSGMVEQALVVHWEGPMRGVRESGLLAVAAVLTACGGGPIGSVKIVEVGVPPDPYGTGASMGMVGVMATYDVTGPTKDGSSCASSLAGTARRAERSRRRLDHLQPRPRPRRGRDDARHRSAIAIPPLGDEPPSQPVVSLTTRSALATTPQDWQAQYDPPTPWP